MRLMILTVVGVVGVGLLCGAAGLGQLSTAVKAVPKTAAGELSARAINPQPEPSKFRVLSIQQLKTTKQAVPRLRITGPGEKAIPLAGVTMRAVLPGAGCPDYASGSGVVLRPLQPWQEPSGSTLTLRGVFWNEGVRRRVTSGEEDASFALEVGPQLTLGATAYFQDLPSGLHTYLLSIGTSAPRDRVRLRIGEYFSQPGRLVANPETSAVRALFTYDAGRHENRLAVYVQHFPVASGSDYVHFHHIQLAQLD